jgi:tRNA threonylcarbamoyladenosine biosynthesis protein TsaB
VSLILGIESSTLNCSVALFDDGQLLHLEENASSGYRHAEWLHAFIDRCFAATNKQMIELKAVMVCRGPGSYTGLRIGVSAAKGLCYALNIPLLSVSSTELLALAAPRTQHVISVLDARRMEVYVEVRNEAGEIVLPVQAMVAEHNFMQEFLVRDECVFIGDAAEKLKTVLTHPNVRLVQRFPSAEFMGVVAERKYREQETEDVAYFEPFYLKDFVAGAPRKLL